MPVGGLDSDAWTYFIENPATGERLELDNIAPVRLDVTTAHNIAPVVTTAPYHEEYHGFTVRRLGTIETERDLPWPPEYVVRDGDTYHVAETWNDWIWLHDYWEEIRLVVYDGNENDNVQVEPEIPWVEQLRMEDATIGVDVNQREIDGIYGEVQVDEAVAAAREGRRYYTTAAHDAMLRHEAVLRHEADDTTDTTPEAFDDIFEVGA